MSVSNFDRFVICNRLRNLAETANESDFQEVIGELDPKEKSLACKVSNWLSENLKYITKEDVSSLLHIKNKIITFCKVSPEDSSVQKIQSICLSLLGNPEQNCVMQMIGAIFSNSPEDERRHIYDLIKNNQEIWLIVVGTLSQIPKADRSFMLFEQLIDIYQHTKERESIFQAITSIPLEQRAQVIEFFTPLLKCIPEEARLQILRTINCIPSGQIVNVLKKIVFLLKHTVSDRQEIVETIEFIPLEQRAQVLELAEPLLQDMTSGSLSACVLRLIVSIPLEQRAQLIKLTIPLLEDIEDKEERVRLLVATTFFPLEQRVQVIELARPLLKEILEGKRRVLIIALAGLFPPDKMETYFQTLSQFKNELPQNQHELIELVLSQNASLVEPTHNFLIQTLQSLTDAEDANELAGFIWNNLESFLIYDEHPLAQEALNEMILTTNTEDPKNPYKVYQELRDALQIPTPPLLLPSEEIASLPIVLNLETFQKIRSRQKPITFAKLPKVGVKDLNHYFQSFENRLAQLKPDKREETVQAAQDIVEASFEKLKNNFVNDPYIHSLLHIQGNPDASAPLGMAYFFAIMRCIADQSNELNDEKLLSAREEMLLLLSESIQNCKTGKEEGIIITYSLLDSKYKYKSEKGEILQPELEEVLDYLDEEIVQKTLNHMLSGENAMMRAMTQVEVGSIIQLAHQSLYLKNLIGHRIGLNHELKFDFNTGMLRDHLHQKELGKVLDIFYRYVTPQVFIQALQRFGYADPNDKYAKAIYTGLNRLLAKVVGIEKAYSGACWEFGEDDVTVKLTEAGARDILLAAGYFQKA